jgi:hypothetical protein
LGNCPQAAISPEPRRRAFAAPLLLHILAFPFSPPRRASRNVVVMYVHSVVERDPQGADAGIFSNDAVDGVPGGKPLET